MSWDGRWQTKNTSGYCGKARARRKPFDGKRSTTIAKRMKHQVLKVAVLVTLIGPASALAVPILLIDSGGQLTGALNVEVNGTLFDVTVQDGTCIGLFAGCDELEDFTFRSEADALAASKALLDQVVRDGPGGLFDSDPSLNSGCENNTGMSRPLLNLVG